MFFISPLSCYEQYIKHAVCFQLSVHSEALLDAVLPAVVDHAWTFIYGAALRPSNDAYPNVRGTDQFGGKIKQTEKQCEWKMENVCGLIMFTVVEGYGSFLELSCLIFDSRFDPGDVGPSYWMKHDVAAFELPLRTSS